MFNWIKQKFLERKFKKQFVHFNKWTLQAFKVKTDEDFKKLCLECVNEIAGQHKKDIKSLSLEDIYRVLHKIREKTPKILRKITLYQLIKLKDIGSKTSDAFYIIKGISGLAVIPLIYVGLKKIIGKRVEYAFKMYIVSLIANELYKENEASKREKKPNVDFRRKGFKTSPELKAIVGSSYISRPEANKKIWEYINKNGLQDKKNRRQINVGGSALGKLFPGKKSIIMFEIAKVLGNHLRDWGYFYGTKNPLFFLKWTYHTDLT